MAIVVAHLNSLKRPAEHSERTVSFFLRETNLCLVLTGQVESNCVKPDSIFCSYLHDVIGDLYERGVRQM